MGSKLRSSISVTTVALVISLTTAGAVLSVTGHQPASGHSILADDKGPTAQVVPTAVPTVTP